MSDDADRADERMEIERTRMVDAVKSYSGPRSIGRCLHCKKKLPHGLRFCDADCRDDWEYEEAAKRRNGR